MRSLLVLAAAMLGAAACDIHISGRGGGFVGGSFPGLDASATKTEDVPLEIQSGDTVDVASEFGAVRLRADDKAPPNAHAKITMSAKTDEDANRVLATWKLAVSRSGSVLTVRAEGDSLEVDAGGGKMTVKPQVEFDVVVPSGVVARATSRSGDVRADGAFAGAELDTSFGQVGVAGARGDVVVRTKSGDATVEDVTASRVEARSSFGTVRLSKIVAASVVGHSNSGAVTCEGGSRGDYELTTSFGEVRTRGGSGSLSAKSKSGAVDASDFDGKVTAHSDFGAIDVSGVLTSANATSSSGAVSVDARVGSKAESAWTVRSNFGDVTLRLPDAFACDLDLGSDFGSLAVDHPGVGRSPDRGAKGMRAKVGAGGETVVVHTKSGSVRVERTSQ